VRTSWRTTLTWNSDEPRHGRPKFTTTATVRHASVSAAPDPPPTPPPASPAAESTQPWASVAAYKDLTIGIVRETYPDERRVAITPQNAALLLKKGFGRVLLERGAGVEAQFTDQAYEHAGVTLAKRDAVWSEADILLKVRAPSVDGSESEVDLMRQGGTIISLLYPAQNRHVVEKLASRGATSFAMDMIPRISRAQAFDALRCVLTPRACSCDKAIFMD
jgi:H+-translocating NAD(P) transhydrogenase